jgi:hypothetical protein
MFEIELSRDNRISIDQLPENCPHCHRSIEPQYKGNNVISEDFVELYFRCPNIKCFKSFIATYEREYVKEYHIIKISLGEIQKKSFSDSIQEISPNFINIFNESFFSEQHKLFEICGVGYRKALEFLIKDYLIKINPSESEIIKNMFLGNCIKEYVSDPKVKKVSERAVWLGNDETHYIRKWESNNLEDLKKLIYLTIHWIEMEELTKSFETKMPNKK